MIGDEGNVGLSAEFKSADPLTQKDILKDWIYELTQYYESFDIWGNPTKQEEA